MRRTKADFLVSGLLLVALIAALNVRGTATLLQAIVPQAVPTGFFVGSQTTPGKFQFGGTGAVSGDCANFDANVNVTGAGTGKGCVVANSVVGPVLLPNAIFVNASLLNISTTGDHDIYTVPANRNAFLLGVTMFNGSGANTVTANGEVSISGVYYPVTTRPTIAISSDAAYVPDFLLLAGEKFSVTITAGTSPALNVFGSIVEFDAGTPLVRGLLTSVINGDNTLYTAPMGKTAEIFSISSSATSTATISFCNFSGSSRTAHLNVVPNGGSPTVANQLAKAQTFSNLALSAFASPATFNFYGVALGSGDFLSVNTNASTATQVIWVTALEK